MEEELQDLSQAVGVVERDHSDQQRRSTVLALLVHVPMGAAGVGGPTAPCHPPAWVRAVGSKAAAAAPCSGWLKITAMCLLCLYGGFRNNPGKFWPSQVHGKVLPRLALIQM